MKIKQLPAQENPKTLSAQHHSKTLQEHFFGFMNANNANGFMDDSGVISEYTKFAERPEGELFSIDLVKEIDKSTIASIMIAVATRDTIPYKELLQYAYQMKEVSNKKIKLTQAMIIVARMVGYFNMEAVNREICTRYQIKQINRWDRDKYMVINRRDRSMLQMKFLEDQDGAP